MIFKCLFCQDSIKDGELICVSNCEHFIHEYCIEQMKSIGDHMCKNCNKITIVDTVFKEFDKGKQTTIDGTTILIDKLNELINILKSRENAIENLTKKYEKVSDRIDSLSIEHRAVKYLQSEMGKRVTNIENKHTKDKPNMS